MGAIISGDEEKYQLSSASALNYFHLPMTRLCGGSYVEILSHLVSHF